MPPDSSRAPSADAQVRDQAVYAALMYSRTAYWIAGAVLFVTAIALGPTLLRNVAPSVLNRVMIATEALVLVGALAQVLSLRRTRQAKGRVAGLAFAAAAAACMIIAHASSVTPVVGISMAAAGVFAVASLVNFRRAVRAMGQRQGA